MFIYVDMIRSLCNEKKKRKTKRATSRITIWHSSIYVPCLLLAQVVLQYQGIPTTNRFINSQMTKHHIFSQLLERLSNYNRDGGENVV